MDTPRDLGGPVTWWIGDWTFSPDETWEHAFAGNGSDCLRCGEGVQMYLHDNIKSPRQCTLCLYFGELRAAVTAFTRVASAGQVGVPVFYCASHFEQADLELYVLNVARHAGEDPLELLEALPDDRITEWAK